MALTHLARRIHAIDFLRAVLPAVLAGVALVAVLLLALPVWGFADDTLARGLGWLGCGLAGAAGLVAWTPGVGRAARSLIAFLVIVGAWFAVQMVPLPTGLAGALNPMVAESVAAAVKVGLPAPGRHPLAIRPEAAWMAWNQWVAALCVAIAAISLARKLAGARFLAGTVGALALLEGLAGAIVMVADGPARTRGFLFNPNHHAALVLMGAPIVLAFLARRHWQGLLTAGEGLFGGKDPALLLAAALLAAGVGWAGAFSRGSLMLGAPVILAWLAYEWWRSRQLPSSGSTSDRRTIWLIAGAVGILMVLAGGVAGRYLSRIGSEPEQMIDQGRIELSRATLEGLVQSNLLGFGLGGVEPMLNRHAEITSRHVAIHTHNDWVEFVGEAGVPGLLAALFCLYGIATGIRAISRPGVSHWDHPWRRAAAAGLLSALAHALVDFHLRLPLCIFAALMLAAVIMTPSADEEMVGA